MTGDLGEGRAQTVDWALVAHDCTLTDCAVPPGLDPASVSWELLRMLGDPDPAVRDGQAYRILLAWIRAGHYDPHLPHMAVTCVALLSPTAGSGLPDNIQARSYAALILAELVTREGITHLRSPERNPVAAEQRTRVRRLAMTVGLNWFATELDVRSADPHLGWLHAAAHGADLARALALHPQTDAQGLRVILEATVRRLRTLPDFLNQTEDDRLALALLAVLSRRELTPADLRVWFPVLADACRAPAYPQPPGVALAVNTVHRLHALLLFGGATLDGQVLRPAYPAEALEGVQAALRGAVPYYAG